MLKWNTLDLNGNLKLQIKKLRENVDSLIVVPKNYSDENILRKDPLIVIGSDIVAIIDNNNDVKSFDPKPNYALICRGFNGDIIEAYILLKNDESIQNNKLFNIIYENENVLIVNKKQGIAVSKNPSDKYCLIDIINEDKHSYELCHRLDRNTGGLLIISKQKNQWFNLYLTVANTLKSYIIKLYSDTKT